jgi:hypothetical protein
MKKRNPVCNAVLAAVVFGIFSALAMPGVACEIPVFRYALERWAPDSYRVLIVHREPLTTEQEQLVEVLAKAATNPASPANLEFERVNLSEKTENPVVMKLQSQYKKLEAPLLVLRQPHVMPDAPAVWTAPLTQENINKLVDSPARQELVRRLTAGHSAVWVMLDTGKAEQDAAAAAVLEKELQRLAKDLKLPEKSVLEADEYFRPDTKVELKLEFSLLRLKPGLPEEEAFRAILLASEPDLHDLKEPIAMPVFGRGRACFALVGKGIKGEEIEKNCQFVVGRCSCQVKHDNPGIDLLLASDWDKLVGSRPDVAKPLSELAGLGVLVVDVDVTSKKTGDASATPTVLGKHTITPVAAAPAAQATGAAAESPLAANKPEGPAAAPADKQEPRVAARDKHEASALARAPLSAAAELPADGAVGGTAVFLFPAIIAVVVVVIIALGTLFLRTRDSSQ